MRKTVLIIALIFTSILYSCSEDKLVTIDDVFSVEKYSTDFYILADIDKNKSLFDGMTAYDLGKIIKNNKEITDSLKGKTYKDVISFIVKYEKERPARELKSFKLQINREIESLEKGFDGSGYRGSVQSIQIELALFEVWKGIYKKAKKSKDEEINKLGENLKKKVSRIQIKEFPKLRKNYGEVAGELMWENNIKVKTGGGKKYNTLTFIGGVFASNKNIKEVQSQISEITNMLRFKRVNYMFTKYDDEYTYYDLKPKKDSDF